MNPPINASEFVEFNVNVIVTSALATTNRCLDG